MVEQLLENVQNVFGKKIQNTRDCELLSEEIFQKTNKYLSYNTLRRFFRLVIDNHVPRKSTLDILSHYIGYSNFEQFLEFQKESIYLDRLSICFKPTNLDMQAKLNSIRELKYSITLVSQLARENIILKNWMGLGEILAWLNEQNYDYESILYFGNSVGSVLRDSDYNLDQIRENPYFFKYIFSIFVDYSSLNGYYGKLIDFYERNNNLSENDLIFVNSLKLFRLFLLNDLLTYDRSKYAHNVSEDIHPILNSRIIATKLILARNNSEIQDVLMQYSLYLKKQNQKISFEFYYEIILICLPIQNEIVFQWLCAENLDKLVVVQHQHNYLNIWKLVKFIYSNSERDARSNKIDFTSNDMFYMRNSYFEFVNFFYLLNKKQINKLNNFDSKTLEILQVKFNYPFFQKFQTSIIS